MAVPTDDHLRAIGFLLAPHPHQEKRDVLHDALGGGASRKEVATFLSRPRTLTEMLEFVLTHHPDRPSLPLFLQNHIRHLLLNPHVTPTRILSVERLRSDAWMQHVPKNLRYVLERVPDDTDYTTPEGLVLLSRTRRLEIEEAYRAHAPAGSVWHAPSAAAVIGLTYLGMGHYSVLACSRSPSKPGPFWFGEGGSNGWERRDNFEKAVSLTDHTIKIERCV